MKNLKTKSKKSEDPATLDKYILAIREEFPEIRDEQDIQEKLIQNFGIKAEISDICNHQQPYIINDYELEGRRHQFGVYY